MATVEPAQPTSSGAPQAKKSSLGAGPSGSSTKTAAQKKFARMTKLRELHLKRNEARKLNHAEVVEEDRRNKLPDNYEAKKRKGEWILQEEEKRKAAEARGEDYDRIKVLDVTAEDAERWDRKKKQKNPDRGFSDYEQASFRQYQRLTKQMKPDMDEYSRSKNKLGADMYPSVDTLSQTTHQDTEEGINRMVADLEKQIDKRSKFSRRRAFNEEGDIDYINERNMRFNKKIERFYGKYTTEIKQSLERGTAV